MRTESDKRTGYKTDCSDSISLKNAYKEGKEILAKAGITEADLDAWYLLEFVTGITKARYYMDPDQSMDPEAWKKYKEYLEKRRNHIPLQHITGSQEFMGLEFLVNEHVLIPRQDTECLVELAVEDIRNRKTQNRCESNNTADQKNEQKVKVLDLCTGSGCIGISVAKLCPDTEVTLADISEGALSVAKKNAQNLDAGVTLIKGNLFENIEGRFDYILSNPPYIPSEVIEGLMPEVKEHEPRLALDGEADGLSFYREIINEAPDYLNPDGRIYFEIGAEQGEDLTHLMNERGFSEVKVHKDLAGLDRIVTGIYSRK